MEGPNFEDLNKESSEPIAAKEGGGVKNENPFAKMNRDRALGEYNAIKPQMERLDELLKKREAGTQGLDSEIDSLKHSLKSSVEEFVRRNPNSPLSGPLKKMIGID